MLPAMPEIKLPQGTVRYSESGSGDTIVLVHGALVDGRLWHKVMPLNCLREYSMLSGSFSFFFHSISIII